MQLLAYARGGTDRAGSRLGIQTDRGVRDLTDALGVGDVGALLRRGAVGSGGLVAAAGEEIAASEIEIRAPIARPGKIICVGLNYHDHCREQRVEPPRYLRDGDVMRCEIEGIGAIENPVVDETPRIDDHAEAAGLRATPAGRG